MESNTNASLNPVHEQPAAAPEQPNTTLQSLSQELPAPAAAAVQLTTTLHPLPEQQPAPASVEPSIHPITEQQPAAAAVQTSSPIHPVPEQQPDGVRRRRGWGRFLDDHSHWLEGSQEALMVVATLVAGFAMQAGLNPPGGLLEERYYDGFQYHEVGKSVLGVTDPVTYRRFYFVQTVSLLSALTVILLSVSGLPLNRRAHVWMLRIIAWVAITCVAIMDRLSVGAFTPSFLNGVNPGRETILYGILTWVVIMSLVLSAVLIRVIRRLVNRMRP